MVIVANTDLHGAIDLGSEYQQILIVETGLLVDLLALFGGRAICLTN